MLYLYGVTRRADTPIPELTGLSGASVETVAYQDLAAVVSQLTTRELPANEANLWLHETVIERVMELAPILPMRFGTVFTTEARVQELLGRYLPRFVEALARVERRVELGLRVLWDDSAKVQPLLPCNESNGRMPANHQVSIAPSSSDVEVTVADGRSYLAMRQEKEREETGQRRRAELLLAEIHLPLSRLAVESTHAYLLTPRMPLTATYLIDREHMPTFQANVRDLAAAHPAFKVLCTGPWPPYSFVTDCVPKNEMFEG